MKASNTIGSVRLAENDKIVHAVRPSVVIGSMMYKPAERHRILADGSEADFTLDGRVDVPATSPLPSAVAEE